MNGKTICSDYIFPDPDEADSNGIVAIGGDLSCGRLIAAYRQGIFPWYSNGQPILWWSPDPRGIIPLENIYINKTLKKQIKKNLFQVTRNVAFEEVINGCATAHNENGEGQGWITDDMIRAYISLHQYGVAHSFETWQDGILVGGVYGVSVGGLFAGESMFYRKPNASKIALYNLMEHLRSKGYVLFDCQMITNLTKSMGAIEISRKKYMELLAEALKKNPQF